MQNDLFQTLIVTGFGVTIGILGYIAKIFMNIVTGFAVLKELVEADTDKIKADIQSIAGDVAALRKYDAQIAVLLTETTHLKQHIENINVRIDKVETTTNVKRIK